tara:strand:- start:58 stop:273 length:216 start_codon:yes stop_codon:yes gene_type:complete
LGSEDNEAVSASSIGFGGQLGMAYVATTVAGGSGYSFLEIESIDIGVDWAEKTRVRHDKIYGNEARHCVGY